MEYKKPLEKTERSNEENGQSRDTNNIGKYVHIDVLL